MSVFLCAKCDELRDSDDGCREYDGGKKGTPDGDYRSLGLVCSDCMGDEEEYEGCGGDFTPAQQAIIDGYTAEEEDDGEGL